MTPALIIALVIAVVMGGMGLTIKAQHLINKSLTTQRDAAVGANKALAADCKDRIVTLGGQIMSMSEADRKRIAAANKARAEARAKGADEAGKVNGLLGIAKDPATLPAAQECAAARQILREYAEDATK